MKSLTFDLCKQPPSLQEIKAQHNALEYDYKPILKECKLLGVALIVMTGIMTAGAYLFGTLIESVNGDQFGRFAMIGSMTGVLGVLGAGLLATTGLGAGNVRNIAFIFASMSFAVFFGIPMFQSVNSALPITHEHFQVFALCLLVTSSLVGGLANRFFAGALLELEMGKLSFANQKDCLDIREWIKSDFIRNYRDRVVSQNRRFVKAELNIMKEQFELDKTDEKAACKEVYLDGVSL